MQQATAKMSVLVADIVTDREPLGHISANISNGIMEDLLKDLSGIARINNGELNQIRSTGLMCSFTRAGDAIVAAATMHQIMETHPPENWVNFDSPGLCIRVDTGTVIKNGNKLFGDPVRAAILMQVLAKPHKTLISETTRRHLSDLQQFQTRFVGSLPDDERRAMLDVYEYVGGREEDTLVLDCPHQPSPVAAMDITHGPIVLTVNAQRPRITIGRMTTNHLVLNYPHVSRYHAAIELRNGKLFLLDDSVNGTYVHIGQLGPICLKCDEMQLYGQGIICPGRAATSSSPGAIHYVTR
ncbi:MAG: FHA domain-containing protein [Desulfobacteraceae bacterium]|jgi:class 3 adenylate cyclase